MEIPKSMKSSGDPFMFNQGGAMMIPTPDQFVPIDKQIPKANQFDLSNENQRERLNDLLQKSFKRKAIIWSMDKSWTKEGECIVAVFYSEVVEDAPKSPLVSGSSEVKVVKKTSPEIISTDPLKDREDEMFDEFLKFMDESQEGEVMEGDESKYTLTVEDDEV